MKRLIAALIIAISFAGLGHAAYFQAQTYLPSAASNPNLRQENINGLTGSAWQTPSSYYTPGSGNPAVSTADWLHSDGMSWVRPYDLLDSACGSAGTTAAAAFGRYAWIGGADHPSNLYSWRDGTGFWIGFTNDPGVFPSTVRVFYDGAVNATPTVATVTASISNGSGGAGNVLAVSAVSGLITNAGQATVAGAGVTTATISSQSSGTSGGIGNYVIGGAAQNVASQAMTVRQANFIVYQNPTMVCNPDDVSNAFYVYAEGNGSSVQHQQGLLKSNDLVTWSSTPTPTHIALNFSTWSSYQRPVRTGVNTWYSTGLQWVYPSTSNAFNSGKWTSTDGQVWSLAPSLFNSCIPSATNFTTCDSAASAIQSVQEGAPDSVTIGAQAWSISSLKSFVAGSRSGDEWVGRVPIDANFNFLASPSVVKISAPYAGTYPGPTYLQTTTAYIEDGIIHYWGTTGFPISSSNNGLVNAATYANGGGLWQQGLDYFTEIADASAAAGAAPIGVRASCASSVASLTWYNALPTQTYRLYRGTTAGTQATLVGDFTGTSATDSGMTLNAVTYYKLVYLNSGVEQKNRVVSTYCSTSIALVNAHLTRALAAGADATTCDRTWMDTFAGWLTSNSRTNNLQFATMADFCVAKSGSAISKIFDMGTTRLPRGGDYTPTSPANTTYNATGINSKPAWVNGTNTAQGYYGSGRLNNIRRKTQITLFAAYQKPGTAQFTPLAWGETGGMKMTHTSGSPGTISCTLYDASGSATATKAVSGLATDVHTAACTYGPVNGLIAWSDASPGTAVTTLTIPSPNLNPPDGLTGNVTSQVTMPFLGSGSASLKYQSGGYVFSNNEALASVRNQMVLDAELPQGEITTLDALVR